MSWNRVVVPARQATQPGGIGSLESILGLLKSLKIRAQQSHTGKQEAALNNNLSKILTCSHESQLNYHHLTLTLG